MHIPLILSFFAGFASVQCLIQPRFTNVARTSGLKTTAPVDFKFGGPCVADVDGDGIYDLILSYHNRHKAQLFFGNPGGTYTLSNFSHEYYDVHGVNVAQRHARTRERILSVSIGGGSGTNLKRPLVYLVTPDRKFTEITTRLGLGRAKLRGRNTIFMDLAMNARRRNNGGPDMIFMGFLGNFRTRLRQHAYKNTGYTFKHSRIPVLEKELRGRAGVTDIDGDGRMEVVSIRELQVYRLVKPFTFADVTGQVMPEPFKLGDPSLRNTACVEFDFNNDGWPDLYVARADRRLMTRRSRYSGGTTNDILFQNRRGRYVDVSEETGIPKGTNSMGVTAGDFNNDGHVDLFVVQWSEPDILLINRGDGTFKRVNGATPKARNTVGDNAVAFDYNLDGKLDVIIGQGAPNGVKGPYLLMKNLLPSRGDTNYLLVRVHSAPGRGRTALHAVVTVLAGRQRMMRRVGSNGAQAGGGSYLDTVHFGLGRSRFASWVIVEWSNKVIQRRRGVRANRIESFGVV